jgi:hypothetical protein
MAAGEKESKKTREEAPLSLQEWDGLGEGCGVLGVGGSPTGGRKKHDGSFFFVFHEMPHSLLSIENAPEPF